MKLRVSKEAATGALVIMLFLGAHAAVDALDRHDAKKAEETRPAAPIQTEIASVRVTEPEDVIEIPVAAPEVPMVEEDVGIPEPDEDEKIQAALREKAVLVGETKITHYCICKKCCGKDPDHPAYGITASGAKAQPYVSVAVDPKVIPLGSDVLIDYGDGELQAYIAHDTGSGVGGNHIDICVEDHQTALNLGVKTATVYFIAPEN